MMKAQLQFQFPEPGNWGKFILTAVFPDKNGFIQSRRFTQDDITGAQAETFHEVVTRVAVLSDEWRPSKSGRSWTRSSSTYSRRKQKYPGIQGCGRFNRGGGQCPGRTQAFHQSGLSGVHDDGRGGGGVFQLLHNK